MYKTIRHGENSLQYTILPQTDEGKSSNGTERRRRSCGSKRGQKKSLVAYIGLFFVCAVVTGAILVPLMVTTDLMPSPAAWFFKAQKARELRNPATVKYVIEKNNNLLNSDAEKKLNISNLIVGGNLTDITTTTILQSSSVFDSTTFQDTSPSTIPTVTSTVLPPLPTSTSPESEATEIEATVMLNISTITEVLSTVITSTIQPTILPTTELEILSTSEIPKNPSKPKILLQEIRKHAMMKNIPVKIDDVRIDKTDEEKKNWIKSHWPFVDPSSYFQWAVSFTFCILIQQTHYYLFFNSRDMTQRIVFYSLLS